MDPVLGTALVGTAAYVSRETLNKLLGPTADYLGQGLRDISQKRIENIARIFRSAEQKAADSLEDGSSVSPRVLQAVLNEGSYCEDPLFIDYFGGVLASSRTGHSRDDRGSAIARSLEGMSAYQLRAHFVIYRTIQEKFRGCGFGFDMKSRPKLALFHPYMAFQNAMGYSSDEAADSYTMSMHALFGLHTKSLIQQFHVGKEDALKDLFKARVKRDDFFSGGGFVIEPSQSGAELYAWAAGLGRLPTSRLLAPDSLIFEIDNADAFVATAEPLQ